ncbi:hypothetical protein G6F68_017724 [Rhizopus microsporus]|nr:hypothetical protein G6F68_017724 [Rhizopus microsporus]
MGRPHRGTGRQALRRCDQPGRHHRRAQSQVRFLRSLYLVGCRADRARRQHQHQVVCRPEGQEIRQHADQQLRQAGAKPWGGSCRRAGL